MSDKPEQQQPSAETKQYRFANGEGTTLMHGNDCVLSCEEDAAPSLNEQADMLLRLNSYEALLRQCMLASSRYFRERWADELREVEEVITATEKMP